MMKFCLSFFFQIALVFFVHSVYGYQTVEKSPSSLVIMCLSAHPDDEDGATLAYYAKLKGVKSYSVFYTRGEGGQNEIGSELGDELGVVRTKETQAAAAILGSEIYFLGFPDFGFSKTSKETFAKWGGKDEILSRVVYAIRALKPDIIITNHDTITTLPNRQHGNHQVVGITAYESFEKAADKSFHPEQLNDSVTTWQVKKLYYRLFQRDSLTNTANIVETDLTQRDSSGRTIEEIALTALRQHRSQGMGFSTLSKRRYMLARSDRTYPTDAHDLFVGVTPSMRKRLALASMKNFLPASVNNDSLQHTFTGVLPHGINIGLIKTYDMTLEETMKAFGIRYALLDSTPLASEDLKKYTTIILDLRAYLYRTDAVRYNNRLLEYARNGGNLLCFYHKSGDWNGKQFAPYPITLTNERVTEEDVAVTMIQPGHPFFNQPNRITQDDWNGWVQERSLYLPAEDTTRTSPAYKQLLAMSDEGEHQPSTALLWCRYGKGTYSYVSLALYRQLRIKNDGALKLFFNLIAQPSY